MRSDFSASLAQITAEKGLQKDELIDMVEAAMAAAYRKDFAGNDEKNIVVRMEPQTGVPTVHEVWEVAEVVEDPLLQMALEDARKLDPEAQLGGKVERDVTPPNFGRIGAQTAKQVILQRIREAERDHVYQEFIDREGDIITGVVRRIDPRGMVLETGSAGKAEALLPPSEQVSSERHRMGQRIRVYMLEVNRALKGPMLIVSRAHRNFVRRMMELEIPEIYNGIVEIRAIAREPGSRSKVAVWSRQSGLDPVGACVGQRGMRIQNIVNELAGERIDIIPWQEDQSKFVAAALSPARVLNVHLEEATKTASVTVPESQLSLAIGKEGQNARLAARLTGWRVDIKSDASPKDTVESHGPEHPEELEALNDLAAEGTAGSDVVAGGDATPDGAPAVPAEADGTAVGDQPGTNGQAASGPQAEQAAPESQAAPGADGPQTAQPNQTPVSAG